MPKPLPLGRGGPRLKGSADSQRRFQHSQSRETVSSDMIESRIPFSESRKQRFDSPVSGAIASV